MRHCLLEPAELRRMMYYMDLQVFYEDMYVEDIMTYRNLREMVKYDRNIKAATYSDLSWLFYQYLRRILNVPEDYCFCPYQHIGWLRPDHLQRLIKQIPQRLCIKFGWNNWRQGLGNVRAYKYWQACRVVPQYLEKIEELRSLEIVD